MHREGAEEMEAGGREGEGERESEKKVKKKESRRK